MDSVNNRSLFQKRSTAARDKVRQMGGVQEPQGILASFQELMQAAAPQRMQAQPARFQQGGPVAPPADYTPDIAMEAIRRGEPEPTLAEQFAAIQSRAMTNPDALSATPTPRERVEVPDISTMVKENIGDNPEALEKFEQLENALTDPDADDEARKAAITDAAGVENTQEGLRDVVTQITGREQPASATVDELNRAISGVALGGAIGGPRSVAARISEALLLGLQAKRETAAGRERFGQELAVAAAGAKKSDGPKGFLETPRGEGALRIFSSLMSPGNKTAEAAYAEMEEIDPNLAAELKAALAGAPAAAPATVDLYPDSPRPEDADQMLELAREAITTGNRNADVVKEMLSDRGINPAEL